MKAVFAGFFRKPFSLLYVLLFLVSLLYAVFSFSLTDPNLILTAWQPYWNFQQWMWRHLFQEREVMTAGFLLLTLCFFGIYLAGLRQTSRLSKTTSRFSSKYIFTGILLATLPLLLSYNALSHDVFNYIFNAKMVLIYQADPHIKTALDYGSDDWTRFMHNTHTPAPYGYGWTALSLIPFSAGLGKFLPTWLLFRVFSIFSFALLWKLLNMFSAALYKKKLSPFSTWLFFANPLVLLEIISNQHNDLWMMMFALGSMLLLVYKPKKYAAFKILLSAALLAASVSIKLATAVLIPLWLVAVLRWYWPVLEKRLTWPNLLLLASCLLFLPLFTTRSQQFLPWYLTWSLVWLPLVQQPMWRAWLVSASFFGLLRYVPWLSAGGFSPAVLMQQKIVLWGGTSAGWLAWFIWSRKRQIGYNRSR